MSLRALATDTAGQLNVLGHDGHTLGVDGAQVGVLKQANQVGLGSFLEGQDGSGLETQVGLELLGKFAHKPLNKGIQEKETKNPKDMRTSSSFMRAVRLDLTWKGNLRMRSSVDFWYLRISRKATVPGL